MSVLIAVFIIVLIPFDKGMECGMLTDGGGGGGGRGHGSIDCE